MKAVDSGDSSTAMGKVALKYGLVGGALTIISVLVLSTFEDNPIMKARFLDFLIIPIFIFFSLKEFRDYVNRRILHFWQGFVLGLVCYLMISLISASFIFTYTKYLNQSVFRSYVEQRVDYLEENEEGLKEEMGEQVYKDTLSSVRNISPLDIALDDLIKKSAIGTLITIIIAVILRKVPGF